MLVVGTHMRGQRRRRGERLRGERVKRERRECGEKGIEGEKGWAGKGESDPPSLYRQRPTKL